MIHISLSPYTVEIHRTGAEPEILGDADTFVYPADAPARHLVDVLLERAEPGDSAIAGWKSVELLDAAYLSAGADGAGIERRALYSVDP